MMLIIRRFKIRSLTKKLKSMQQNRVHNQPSDELLAKEKAMYHKLAAIYRTLRGKKKYPFAEEMVWECLRASARIDDDVAQFELGSHLVEEAKFRETLQQEEVFASPANERLMKQYYEEGIAYLTAAEKLRNVQAIRLHGLCYINGWGLPVDRDRGFELVVNSIEIENSWDKVPQIFASIGLNKPEFFAALMKHRRS